MICLVDTAGALVEALAARKIRALRCASVPRWHGVAVSMSVFDLERFLDILIARPVTEDDRLAMRIFGAVTELDSTDEPWRFELAPAMSYAGIKMRVCAYIPEDDVPEVLARLERVG
jgi:hypothetical protein